MPRESAAVRALKTALGAATTPTQKADIASKLARAQHQQGIERGRRRLARAEKPEPAPQPPVDDSNEEFDFDFPPASLPLLTPQAPAPPPTPPEPDEDEREAAELEEAIRKHGDGSTRVITAMNSPGAAYWDPVRGGYYEDIDPRTSVGPSEWHPFVLRGPGRNERCLQRWSVGVRT